MYYVHSAIATAISGNEYRKGEVKTEKHIYRGGIQHDLGIDSG